MRIFFLNPSGNYNHEYPPLGILYLAASLRKAGFDVSFFDEGAKRFDNISLQDDILRFKPDLIAVSLYTSNILKTFEIISSLKKLLPQMPIVAGGPHATVLPEATMRECKDIDYIIMGEGEATLKELAQGLKDKTPISKIQGLCFREKEEIKRNSQREFIKDLDCVPVPAFDLIEPFFYPYDSIKIGKKVATVMTSRGCPYDCTFCAAKAVWGRSYRRRSAKNVVEEIKLLIEKYGYDEVYFMDDLFASDTKWLDEFYAQMKKNNISIPWKCLGRVDILKFEDYKKMADNGCYMVQFGVESGDDDVLKNINKRITTTSALYAFRAAKNAGLNTYAFFILGHKKDTYQTIHKTIEFAKKLAPDFISFFCLVPFPGTKVYDELDKNLKHDFHRIVYTSWHKDQLPFKLSSVEPQELINFEKNSYLEIYPKVRYLINNILFSKTRKKLLLLKLRFMAIHLRERMRQILSKKNTYTLKNPAKTENNVAFTKIWNEWHTCNDISARVRQHINDRMPLLEIISKYINKSSARDILEVGCGTAIDSACLAKKHGKKVNFYASDISPEAVEVAYKINKMLGSEINLSVNDIENMKFENEKFDIIFSQGVMEHFHDPIPALNEQIRVLKKGGYLIVDVPQKYNPYTLYKKNRIKKGTWEYGWETAYSYTDLRKLGGKLSLAPVDVGSYGYGYFQDYGFSIPHLVLKKLSNPKKGGILSYPSKFILKAFEAVEKFFGHYFMLNIIAVFRK